MQAKASSLGYKRYILHTEARSSPRQGNSHIEHHGQPGTFTKSRKSPPAALLPFKAKRHMATTPPLRTPTRHAACRGRQQQFQTDSYGTCRRRHESHARRSRAARPPCGNLKMGPVVHGRHAQKTSDPGQDDAIIAFQVIDSALCLLQALKTWHPCFLPISRRNHDCQLSLGFQTLLPYIGERGARQSEKS